MFYYLSSRVDDFHFNPLYTCQIVLNLFNNNAYNNLVDNYLLLSFVFAFDQICKNDACQKYRSNPRVWFELLPAIFSVVNIDRRNLPCQMRSDAKKPQKVRCRLSRELAENAQTAHHAGSKTRKPQFGIVTETKRCRFDANQWIVGFVLKHLMWL